MGVLSDCEQSYRMYRVSSEFCVFPVLEGVVPLRGSHIQHPKTCIAANLAGELLDFLKSIFVLKIWVPYLASILKVRSNN